MFSKLWRQTHTGKKNDVKTNHIFFGESTEERNVEKIDCYSIHSSFQFLESKKMCVCVCLLCTKNLLLYI